MSASSLDSKDRRRVGGLAGDREPTGKDFSKQLKLEELRRGWSQSNVADESTTKLLTTGGSLDSIANIRVPFNAGSPDEEDDNRVDSLTFRTALQQGRYQHQPRQQQQSYRRPPQRLLAEEMDDDNDDEVKRDLSLPNLTEYDLEHDRRSLTTRIKQDVICNKRLWLFVIYHSALFVGMKRVIKLLYLPTLNRAFLGGLQKAAVSAGLASAASVSNRSGSGNNNAAHVMTAAIKSALNSFNPLVKEGTLLNDALSKEMMENDEFVSKLANKVVSLSHSVLISLMSLHFWWKQRRSVEQAKNATHYRHNPDELTALDHTLGYLIYDTMYLFKYESRNINMFVHHLIGFICVGSTRLAGFGAPAANLVFLGMEPPTIVYNFYGATSLIFGKLSNLYRKLFSLDMLKPGVYDHLKSKGGLLYRLKFIKNSLYLLFAALFAYLRVFWMNKVGPRMISNAFNDSAHVNLIANLGQVSQAALMIGLGDVWALFVFKKAVQILKEMWNGQK